MFQHFPELYQDILFLKILKFIRIYFIYKFKLYLLFTRLIIFFILKIYTMSSIFISNILFPSLLASIGWGIAPILDKEAMLINDNFRFVYSVKLIFISILNNYSNAIPI